MEGKIIDKRNKKEKRRIKRMRRENDVYEFIKYCLLLER